MENITVSSIRASTIKYVEIGLDFDDVSLYVEAMHRDGSENVGVSLNVPTPATMKYATFAALTDKMTEKDLENVVLDWIISQEGSEIVNEARKAGVKYFEEI